MKTNPLLTLHFGGDDMRTLNGYNLTWLRCCWGSYGYLHQLIPLCESRGAAMVAETLRKKTFSVIHRYNEMVVLCQSIGVFENKSYAAKLKSLKNCDFSKCVKVNLWMKPWLLWCTCLTFSIESYIVHWHWRRWSFISLTGVPALSVYHLHFVWPRQFCVICSMY